MSTFYASFTTLERAQNAVHEMVSGGLDPDDLSLVAREPTTSKELTESPSRVGDATAFVGRTDDPEPAFPIPRMADITELTSIEMSRISPIDTSNSDTDVDSVDQMEDSQEEYELEIRPRGGVSQGSHEMDDVALTVTTGFPTPVPTQDDVQDPFPVQEQLEDQFETIEIPGFGIVAGGGLLATTALDFAKEPGSLKSIIDQLKDDGVPDDVANDLQTAFQNGEAILAVVVTPGEINEDAVEEIAERYGAHNFGLFDAPRY